MFNDIQILITVSTVSTCLFINIIYYFVWYKSRKTTYFCLFSYKNADNKYCNRNLRLEIPDTYIQKGNFQKIIADIIRKKYPYEKINDIIILNLSKL